MRVPALLLGGTEVSSLWPIQASSNSALFCRNPPLETSSFLFFHTPAVLVMKSSASFLMASLSILGILSCRQAIRPGNLSCSAPGADFTLDLALDLGLPLDLPLNLGLPRDLDLPPELGLVT